MTELRANTISKSYGAKVVLRDVSCIIKPAEITTIIGPSGCGKTTLIRQLSFLETPDAGTVSLSVDGRSLCSGNSLAPWPQVTCVFQKQFLWPHLTIRENILLPLRSRGDAHHIQHFAEISKMFAMESFLDRFPNQVSGGEAQRAALARAFALSPRYILLDEAHTFLDMEQQSILNSYLLVLKNRGIGLGIVTHSLSFVENFADHVIVLEDGKIAEEGDRSLLTAPRSRFLTKILKKL